MTRNIITFDVFDTLITRKTLTPYGIYFLMRKELKSHVGYYDQLRQEFVDRFPQHRIYAERIANRIWGKTVTLDQIYDALAYLNGLPEDTAELIKKIEVKTEIENTVGITENINLIKNISEESEVCLISDMYLSESIIRNMLCTVDSFFADIEIWVSCECKASKTEGTIFKKFIEKKKIEQGEWVHVGDNYHSDKMMVEAMGGISNLFVIRNDSKEKYVDYWKNKSFSFASQIVGGVIKNNINNERSDLFCNGLSCTGPILYAYVKWIISDAVKSGITDLYFMSRDGYLLKEIADLIIKEKNCITTHYLYGSRNTWYVEEREESMFLSSEAEKMTCNELFSLFDIDENQFEGESSIHVNDKNAILSELERRILLKIINNAGYRIKDNLDRRKRIENTKQYLQQTITSDSNYAIVDVHGTGKTINDIYNLLGEKHQIKAYYFAYYPYEIPNIEQVYVKTYMQHFLNIPYFLEAIARANHAQVVGYKNDGKEWKPVFYETGKDYLNEEDFNEYKKGVLAFCEWLETNDNNISESEWEEAIREFVVYINSTPNTAYTEFIGEMPFEMGVDDRVKKFGPKLSEEELGQLSAQIPIESYNGACLKYSLLRSTGKAYIPCNMEREDIVQRIKEKNTIDINKRIILYGAGYRGKQTYSEILDRKDIEIVAWVDQNFKKMDGFKKIESPDSITEREYDYIYVEVLNPSARKQIEEKLYELGVSKDKIII